jgi:5-formaminoimidazole-4-carboxamide-1-(beta)-D-ribofuranosyl 5'-monophosphate synthetase
MAIKLPVIATLGGHSALEIFAGAKKYGFRTLVLTVKGRDKTYLNYFKNLVDDYLILDSFTDLSNQEIVTKLNQLNCIFIPHRYCQVYCDLLKLEKDFNIPIFGNKYLLKYEEREGIFNQYQLLYNSQVDYPKQFKDPKKIDRLCIIKVKESDRGYERAFFFAKNYSQYLAKSQKLLHENRINNQSLKDAVIEEYLVGVQVNFNFYYSPLKNRLELLSTDMRRQTNIDGLIRLPSDIQQELKNDLIPSYIETGHVAVTVKESLLERAYILAQRILDGTKLTVPGGIIGPFALQTAIVAGPPKEKIVIYDLSLRIPGSPGTAFTPYSGYLFGENMTFGDRIALEIKEAVENRLLSKIIT